MREIEPGSEWPAGLTLEQDLAQMGWHDGEFRRRTSFAFMLLADRGRRTLGCVYLLPDDEPYDARLDFWVTAAAFDDGLELRLAEFLRSWLDEAWPFRRVRWPHRIEGDGGAPAASAATAATLVPDDFSAPPVVHEEPWHLEAMTIHHVLRDFQCFLENREHLETAMKQYHSDWEWVWPPGLTFELDIAEMGWCQVSFRKRTAFCYMLLADEGRRSLGCVYLFPSEAPHDARLEFWVTEAAFREGLETPLAEFLRRWLREAWPFQHVSWPERHQ
jgi:hypothetical protein